MTPNFGIGIPTLNRADLLLPALMYYRHDFPETKISVIDNGHQEIKKQLICLDEDRPHVLVYDYYPAKNIGVARSWNFLIKNIFLDNANEFAIILNDDIYWGRDQEDMRIFLAQFSDTIRHTSNADKGFILIPENKQYSWCVFIISYQAWKTIGEFDRNFWPAYFEDKDYEYRAKLAGVTIYNNLRPPARYVHSGSSQKDKSIPFHSKTNRDYYVRKWGGEPGSEIFTVAFNSNNKDPKEDYGRAMRK